MSARTRWMPAVVLILAAGVGATPAAAAAPVEAEFSGTLRFSADVASFPGPEGKGETHLYLEVPYSGLYSTAQPEKPPAADVQVTVSFSDPRGRRLAGGDWTYRVPPDSLAGGDEGERSLRRRYRFPLPAGEARVRVRVADPAQGRSGELAFATEVPPFADTDLAVSDLVFGTCDETTVSVPDTALEGPVRPHPSRRYGAEARGICVFARLADALDIPDTAYAVRYEVKDTGGRSREKGTATVVRDARRGEMLLRPQLAGLTLGRYRLEVRVDLGGRRVEREGWFEVDETQVSFLADEDMIRTVLGYVATNEELIQLEDEPADSLESIYRRFWARRDPDPNTRRNEALVEFMRRVDYATRHFGVLEPGWRSDMGRIHIKFGAPDRIETVVNDSAGPPAQIWYYYSRNATFVFQDMDGFGRYVLSRTVRD